MSSPKQPLLAVFLERMLGCQGEGEVGIVGYGRVTDLKEKGQDLRMGVLRREATLKG